MSVAHTVRRCAALLVAAVAALSVAVVLAAPAVAADPITPTDLTITVTGLGPEARTCELDADLYVPTGVSAAAPAPAILATNGFGGTKDDQAGFAQSLGAAGYVTLSYTGLGFVDGNLCPIALDDREHDGAAASQVLRFLAGDPSIAAIDDATGQPLSVDFVILDDAATYDPRAGMVGGSYGGQVQFATVGYEAMAGEPERLDAIIPIITWNDLSYSLAPNNTDLPAGESVSSMNAGVAKYQWALLFTSLGIGGGVQDLPAATDPVALQSFLTESCANFVTEVCTALTEIATQGYPSRASIDFLRGRSVGSYIEDITVPTLIAQGQADTLFNLQESIATYRALQEQGTDVKLMWQSWGHSNSVPVPGELDQADLTSSYQGQVFQQWLDYYLKGPDPALDCPAPSYDFSYFRDYAYSEADLAPDAQAAYAVAPEYPVGTETPFYLSGTDALVQTADDIVAGTTPPFAGAPVIGPNYTETSALDQTLTVTDPPGTTAQFRSGAIEGGAVTVAGVPRVTVRFSSAVVEGTQTALGDAGELVVFAKLYDIAPDGTTIELPNRLISPVRVPDITESVEIELPGIVHRFEVGHRIAVTFAGGDLAYRGSTSPQPVSVLTDTSGANVLSLPLVVAEQAAPAPQVGCLAAPPATVDPVTGPVPGPVASVLAAGAGRTSLAYTNGTPSWAYRSTGLLQIGGGLLFCGAVLVAAVPVGRARPRR